MYIYRNKINIQPHLVDEDLTVIFPTEIEVGADILTMWKWAIGTDNEVFKQIKSATGTISGLEETGSGLAIYIQYNQDYQSEATITADGKSLAITMCTKDGSNSFQAILYLIHKNGTEIDTDLPLNTSLVKSSNDFFLYSCQVINDTDILYYCHLDGSTTEQFQKSTVLGAIGIAYSFVGIITVNAPTGFGIAFGVHSLLFGISTLLDTLFGATSSTTKPVAPGHSISRTGRGFWGSSSLILTRMKIKQKGECSTLVVETGSYDSLSHNEINYITKFEKKIKWKQEFELTLTNPQNLAVRSFITINKFEVQSDKSESFNIRENLIHHNFGTWFSYVSDEDKKNTGTVFNFIDWKNEIKFKYNPRYSSAFIEKPTKELIITPDYISQPDDTGVVEIVKVSVQPGETPEMLLRLKGYGINPTRDGGRSDNGKGIGTASNQKNVLSIISKQKEYIAYLWNNNGRTDSQSRGVYAYTKLDSISKVSEVFATSYVYLWVSSANPYLKLEYTQLT
ncbi:hypothetical protein XBP1_2750002 [Xenorhabdus bovienii str. puntauvense]|uniref:Uncharacterized protein n=1 Tax=Xenorhabdus bovienii str. puntauvense TaxID=1398201 RepID=A0A077NH43_XENBV|nr:hypothetical protein [Xenorhabdus bovienii]CDG97708.1 hypothetical protein XBP1_2750002 [Xenorhabdus bovienii str. puntauvense]